jgi:hypothetical protein
MQRTDGRCELLLNRCENFRAGSTSGLLAGEMNSIRFQEQDIIQQALLMVTKLQMHEFD